MSHDAGGKSALSEMLGAVSEARGCDNCGKRGPWQTEYYAGKNKAMTYELAECHHHPKPAWWKNSGPLWVAHGCGSGCQVWSPIEAPNVGIEPPYSVGSNDGLGPWLINERN